MNHEQIQARMELEEYLHKSEQEVYTLWFLMRVNG